MVIKLSPHAQNLGPHYLIIFCNNIYLFLFLFFILFLLLFIYFWVMALGMDYPFTLVDNTLKLFNYLELYGQKVISKQK
jgi:hypothetical protein